MFIVFTEATYLMTDEPPYCIVYSTSNGIDSIYGYISRLYTARTTIHRSEVM